MSSMSWSRVAVAAAATVALVLAVPLGASAHVRVTPRQAVAGADDTLLTFSVPTESGAASTTRVVIELPTSTPFGDVSYQPVPGWTARVVDGRLPKPAKVDATTITEAPLRIEWTADPGTKLVSGQFQDFVLSVGPMPRTGRIAFPTTQTYSDGTVVRWSQATPATGQEPDHPAPVLYVEDAPPGTERLTSDAVGLSAEAPATSSDLMLVAVLAAAALVLAVLAGGLGVLAVVGARRSRRP
ncbi:YcnI family protein [Amnibacterium sp.]|uniref:YcnI family copper-binding membrane protein n=1 Tax=Amnibacterium sp. TaxID=1872496 RepID=UPI0026174E76|nr:YcnI family protein [Amnibacterium sp.]MCU1474130.1 hypothetical protein [Amnibacterium sp.]